MPPEWVSGEFYCPFKSDVYQLAKVWQETLVVSILALLFIVSDMSSSCSCHLTDKRRSHARAKVVT